MNENIFGIDNFNLISDNQYYYVFRALNRDDQREINEGITSVNGEIQKVLTNKQRYPENAKYAKASAISLKEVWDHTKSVNFYRGTNCISLSSNANVSIDYGSKYGHKYLMIKIPKDRESQVYNAGQYMITELNRILDERLKEIPQNSEILNLINEIENKKQNKEIREIISERFKNFRTGGKYTSKVSVSTKESLLERFKSRQAFSQEQQLEYAKLMGKLTILELSGMLPKEILANINIASLTSTIGSEFSNREFIHYGEINSDEFVPISKINLDMFALVQVAKEQGISEVRIKQIEEKLIEYTNQGYELISKDGKLYYSNGENEIDLNLNDDSVLVNENTLQDNTNISIEEMFEKTNGTISYLKAKNAAQFVHNLSIAQRKTFELANVLKSIVDNSALIPVIDEIAKKSIAINDRIITRKNGRGIQVSESVNIDMNRGERKQFSDEEQANIYERVRELAIEELDSIISNNGNELEQEIYISNLKHININSSKTREERLNRYYAETIIDTLDISKIYKNAIRDKNLNEQEREMLLARLEKADCKRLVNAFTKAGISESEVAGYIVNILASNGYQGYTFDEFSRLTNLDEIIIKNINNNNLKGHVYSSVMEELRGIRDNDNRVGDTLIKLRDYQQETVDNVDRIFADGKRFAGVVLPTGAGKSFVAMTEMLKNQNGNILYIAPQQEILSQVQRHILKNIARVEVLTSDEINKLKEEQNTTNIRELILPEGKILPSQTNEYVKKVFPHLKMLCYQGLSSKDDIDLNDEQRTIRDNEEKELREILKNADANLIIFDELHRSGAKTWKNVVEQLINSNEKANILGITATPIRDADHVDMMKELAEMVHTYSDDELATKQYLGYEMYLTDAIQRGLVVEPKLVSFDFMLRDTDEYQEILEMIATEKNEAKKKQLMEIKAQIDDLISGDTDITEHIKNNISQKENEEIGKIIQETIQKKDGRYIVFLPQHSRDDGLSENQYFEQQEKKIREILAKIDAEPEISRLSSADSKAENHRAITDFENSSSKHLKIMLAINKLNEGVHVDGINGEIMYRKINDGSTILYLQQLGRVIYSLDPNTPIADEDIPIVYDVYNNYLVQNMNRTINQTTPKSDLQKLQEIIEWMDKHGYEPDINSENIKEARKAITLKKIQTKYKKYIDGINNPRLSKSDIYEIEQTMELAHSIDLFNMEIGNRIIPPDEKDLSEVQLFKVSAIQKKFLELYKSTNKIFGNEERKEKSSTAKLNDIMNILETLNSNDIFIDNSLIQYGDTLNDVISKCPEEIRQILQEELYMYEEEYPIGREYNFAKASFRDSRVWKYFENSDVRELYACGIFESVDDNYLDSIQDDSKKELLSRNVLSNNFVVVGTSELKYLHVKTGTYYDEDGNTFKTEEKDEHSQSDFEELVSIIESLYTEYNCSFLANEHEDSIPENIREYIYSLIGENIRKTVIPQRYKFKEKVINAREHLKDEELDIDTLIKYKKYGILPLNLNEDGIDIDTGLSKDEFSISSKQFVKEFEDKKRFDKIVKVLNIGLRIIFHDYTFANETETEIPDCSPLQLFTILGYGEPTGYRRLSNSYNIREEILFARNYLKELNNDYTDIEEIKSLKMMGILPLNLDEKGIDIETGLSKEQFKGNLSEEYEKACRRKDEEEKRKFESKKAKTIEVDDELRSIFKGIDTAIKLMKEGIITEGQNIEKSITVKDLLINAGFTDLNEIEGICSKMGIDSTENIGEELAFIKSAYDLENVKAGTKIQRSYAKMFREFSDRCYEMALLGIIPVSKNGVVQRGTYKGKTIQEYKDLMIARENEREKEKQKIKKLQEQKRHISNHEGYNEDGEYFYKGKFYMYNPETGKKADGTYALEARNERGFNPDHTFKDTGEYYDENGLNWEYRNREGIDVRYGFGIDGYYYKKQEDGTYINTKLKHNPMGFRADRRHAVTKLALDPRGFDIDGVCKRNKDSIYDQNGFKQDGTYQETGELYHNGYNAFGVDITGKTKTGKIHSDIIFAQGYIDAILSGKKNTYLKQIYRNINTTNYNKILAEVDIRLYKATLMYPELKEKQLQSIRKCFTQLTLFERKLQNLEAEKTTCQQEIEKCKKSIEILKERIGNINPMER